jgi:uncharacterized membrane protein (UPF0127 family)
MNFKRLFLSLLQNSVSFAEALAVSRLKAVKHAFLLGCTYKTEVLQVPLFIYFFLCIFFSTCNSQKLPVQNISIERNGQPVAVVKAEIASTPEDRREGLMHRKKLPDGEGMFFIFERDGIHSFWMRNTIIPLSIAFITSDGRILEIKDMYPGDENSVSPSRSIRYALETPQGWFSRAGVQSGDIVIFEN